VTERVLKLFLRNIIWIIHF